MNYSKLFSLEGKYALITGGTGGLGGEIARAFIDSGARVAVCGNHPERADSECLAVKCNICDEGSVNDMMNTIAHEFGTLDILVNSAGKNILIPAEDYDTSSFLDVMNLNINALHTVTREAGKR
ncbi:MAG: SDR family NAD(P)-dependent oxidoreductase, partial [Synergistaceae bacterium]|nr:SDR family NAD(P)-dependent oxidoreductase [Synergistaceae bacterium]